MSYHTALNGQDGGGQGAAATTTAGMTMSPPPGFGLATMAGTSVLLQRGAGLILTSSGQVQQGGQPMARVNGMPLGAPVHNTGA